MSAQSDTKTSSVSRPELLKSLATQYLAIGFVPIPLEGKKPLPLAWQTINKDTALKTLEQFPGANNLGILTGTPSQIVVLDIDVRENGLETWRKLITEHDIPKTLIVETGSGGYHVYFQYDPRMDKLTNSKVKGIGFDFKTTGGQVVAAGSIHPITHKEYLIISGYQKGDTSVKLALMPDFLYSIIYNDQLTKK
jgi:hypothetical protein